jgi:O-methyltransferase involved in polyketide biosynthesis
MAGVTNQLSETAYLVAESRARALTISRDVYAARWIPDRLKESVRRLWEEFAADVYPHDDVVLGVRNRFFLERLSVFAAGGPAIFVNIAAGFTSYPFLLEQAVRTIEIDLPAIVEVKSARLGELQRAGVLPIRPVRLIAADLNDASDRERIGSLLAAESNGARSFVLLEGISYYLAPQVLDSLLAALARVQPAGSVLALDYWPLAME